MSDHENKKDGEEFDQLVEGLERVERARKRKVLLITLTLLVIGAAALVAAYTYREALFVPDLDIDGGEAEVLAETNDPQCRTLIATITATGKQFGSEQEGLEKKLLSDSKDDISAAKTRIQAIRQELVAAQTLSKEANLRFPESTDELNQWFKHVDNEFRVLESVADDKLAELTPPEIVEEDGKQVVELKVAKKRPPQERVGGAMLAADDAFQNFRVWHTSSMHPCGKAAEDEKPWEPEDELGEGRRKAK